jgi:hypothetical protein
MVGNPHRKTLLAPLLVLLAGCGYSFEPLARKGIRTVQVPIFRNETNRRELEYPLTEAVSRELRRAGYRIAPPGGGDAVLLGRIVGVTETVLSESPSGALGAGRVDVAVEFKLLRTGSGESLASAGATEGGEVVFARGEDRPQGMDRAVQELARSIVRRLEPPPP